MKTIKLGKNNYTAKYLDDEHYEILIAYCQDFFKDYNYFPEYYEKIKFLPESDRQTAVAEMLKMKFSPTPEMLQEVLYTVPALQFIAHFCLGASYEDCGKINGRNKKKWAEVLHPLLRKIPIVFPGYDVDTQIMMINQVRKEKGLEVI